MRTDTHRASPTACRYSFYPLEVRTDPRFVRYLDWTQDEEHDGSVHEHGVVETPFDLLKSYVTTVLPTGLVVLRTIARPGTTSASEIDLFRRRIAPTITTPFCLITVDGDDNMPATHSDATILEHPHLTKWYSINWVGTEALIGINADLAERKVRAIPILLDLHTSVRGGVLNTPRWASQREKYDEMLAIRARASLPPQERTMAAVLVHMSITHPSREDLLKLAGRPGVVWTGKSKLPTETMWEKWFSTHAFGISPRGHGVDCHRTWEMLFFNMIPIVRTSVLDPLCVSRPRRTSLPTALHLRALGLGHGQAD